MATCVQEESQAVRQPLRGLMSHCYGRSDRLASTMLVLTMALSGCVTSPADGHRDVLQAADSRVAKATTTAVSADCPRVAGYSVVWSPGFGFDGSSFQSLRGTEVRWLLLDSAFQLVSAVWVRTDRPYFGLSEESRACVDQSARWVLEAAPPPGYQGRQYVEYQSPDLFDESTWDLMTAHPWRLTGYGQVGVEELNTAGYLGVIRISDETVMVRGPCGSDAKITKIRGFDLAPRGGLYDGVLVCEPPHGYEEPDESAQWSILTSGTPTVGENTLTITHDGVQYRYEPITEEEFLAEYSQGDLPVFKDPLGQLAGR